RRRSRAPRRVGRRLGRRRRDETGESDGRGERADLAGKAGVHHSGLQRLPHARRRKGDGYRRTEPGREEAVVRTRRAVRHERQEGNASIQGPAHDAADPRRRNVRVAGGRPMTYAAAALALVLYAQGFARLRRRRRSLAPAWAAWAFAGGVTIALGALAPPLDRLADSSLTAHMSQHLLLG